VRECKCVQVRECSLTLLFSTEKKVLLTLNNLELYQTFTYKFFQQYSFLGHHPNLMGLRPYTSFPILFIGHHLNLMGLKPYTSFPILFIGHHPNLMGLRPYTSFPILFISELNKSGNRIFLNYCVSLYTKMRIGWRERGRGEGEKCEQWMPIFV